MRIGFVSTRFAGTDGVSLESWKWAEVLEAMGHDLYWFSGRSDRDPSRSYCVPEAFFGHPWNEWINERLWNVEAVAPEVGARLEALATYLESMLERFVHDFEIDFLIPENALAIPVHLPLGVALANFLARSGLPALAHHHDFWWERERFAVCGVPDLLATAFPPALPSLRHAVINRAAQECLAREKGIAAHLVPNVFHFEERFAGGAIDRDELRAEIGLEPEDFFILQPTRIIPRKGIEYAIELVSRLDDPRCKLVISHDAGDEGFEYERILRDLAERKGVALLLISDRVAEHRRRDAQGRRLYRLWDIYPAADFVTFPSLYEGFGNALLEAVYFRKPVLVNRYSVYRTDIAPKGFRFVEIDGEVTEEAVRQVRALLRDPDRREEMVVHNERLATEHYGYEVLRAVLGVALAGGPVDHATGRS